MRLRLRKRPQDPFAGDPVFEGLPWYNEFGERSDDPRSWWQKMREPWYPPDEGGDSTSASHPVRARPVRE
jgi:hypothetical protein